MNQLTQDYLKQLQETGNPEYFDAAEIDANRCYLQYIKPHIPNITGKNITEVACGRARITNQVLADFEPNSITLVDINQDNLDYCKRRFANTPNINFIKTSGTNVDGILNNSQDFVYSFDSFVHFNRDLVELYVRDIIRVLKVGGICFLHYSNAGSEDLSSSELGHGLRGQMTQAAMLDILNEFEVLYSSTIDWGLPNIDAIVVFKK